MNADHFSDEDLLLYHYGEGLDAAERERISQAILSQPELAMRQRGLVAHLDSAASMPSVRVPDAVHARWQNALEQAARGDRVRAAQDAERKLSTPWFGQINWRTGAAAFGVVLLMTSLGLGLYSNRGGVGGISPDVAPGVPLQAVAGVDETARYERGLQWHLASTEQQLAGLPAVNGLERTRLIDKVIAQNRFYAIAADRANESRLARTLRSFTPILESLADDHAGKGEFEGGLAQLNFELKVMQARLATATSHYTNSPARQLAL